MAHRVIYYVSAVDRTDFNALDGDTQLDEWLGT